MTHPSTVPMSLLRCSGGFTLSLFVGVLLACGIRQDEFDCENAVAHLQQCCPGFNARISCSYTGSCMPTYPELDIPESDCIRNSSCPSLRAAGVCDRVANLPPHGGVCTGPPSSSSCVTTSDCSAGLVCCASPGTIESLAGSVIDSSLATSCQPPPCNSGAQLCETSSDCIAGQICAYFHEFGALGTCMMGTAASSSSSGSGSSSGSSNGSSIDAPDDGQVGDDSPGEADASSAAADAADVSASVARDGDAR